MKPKAFFIDVDGVLTTGTFAYSKEGKILKFFGPDDHDGLSLLKPFLNIHFISGDKHLHKIKDVGIKIPDEKLI